MFQYGKTYHCPEEQGGWDVTDWYVVEGCCTCVKLMPFDHSASLDIISADRRCFGATKNRAPEGHDPLHKTVKFSYVFLIQMKFIIEIEQQTHWLRTYHCYCITSIPILKTRNQTLTLLFFSKILIYIPGAGFFWCSV